MADRETAGEHFDAILIGSGIGALACASVLAQLGRKRVLVLEQHFKLGGFTHVFKREGKYEWDVGLHYVGEMQPGTVPRAVMDCVTAGSVKWNPMPEVYDRFVYPDFVFDCRVGEGDFRRSLQEQFPAEAGAIERYLRDLDRARGWFNRLMIAKAFPEPLARLIEWRWKELGLMTTGEYLEKNFGDPRLKALLASQWGDYGLPPSLSAFCCHAVITRHYMNGAFYPVGGAKSIADSVKPIVEAAGGRLLVNHKVTEILIEDGRAVGVIAKRKKGDEFAEQIEFRAKAVISDAGAYATYTELVPTAMPLPFRGLLEAIPPGPANVTLYVGFREDPRSLGFRGENYWIFNSYDHDELYRRRNFLAEGETGWVYLSFPSLKNPAAAAHTAEVITVIDSGPFQRWKNLPWKSRGTDYETLKARISEALISFVETRFPGFRSLIEFQELSTPLSTVSFTGHREGSIYGLPAVPSRFLQRWLGPGTPVEKLYLTGSDASLHGIVGAMMSGAVTAGMVLGGALGVIRVLRETVRKGKRLT